MARIAKTSSSTASEMRNKISKEGSSQKYNVEVTTPDLKTEQIQAGDGDAWANKMRQFEKDALISRKKSGDLQTNIREGKNGAESIEYDRYQVTLSAEEYAQMDENDRAAYRNTVIEEFASGRAFGKEGLSRSVAATDWHLDTKSPHFQIDVHRHLMKTDELGKVTQVEPQTDFGRSSECHDQVSAINKALVEQGLQPMEWQMELGRGQDSTKDASAIDALATDGVELEVVNFKMSEHAVVAAEENKSRRLGMSLDETALVKARAEIERKMLEAQKSINDNKEQLNRIDQLQAFAAQRGQLEKELASANSENAQLKENNASLIEELATTKETLTNQLETANETISVATTIIAEKTTENEGLSNDYEAVSSELEETKTKLATTDEQLGITREAYKSKENELKLLREKSDKISAELVSAREQINARNADMADSLRIIGRDDLADNEQFKQIEPAGGVLADYQLDTSKAASQSYDRFLADAAGSYARENEAKINGLKEDAIKSELRLITVAGEVKNDKLKPKDVYDEAIGRADKLSAGSIEKEGVEKSFERVGSLKSKVEENQAKAEKPAEADVFTQAENQANQGSEKQAETDAFTQAENQANQPLEVEKDEERKKDDDQELS